MLSSVLMLLFVIRAESIGVRILEVTPKIFIKSILLNDE